MFGVGVYPVQEVFDLHEQEADPKYSALIALLAICVPFSHADEGMWLFNNPPYKTLQDKYHFQPTAAWLEHLQKSSVRFNSGGSGSFVSADGLVMTNHHVGADCLQKISTREKDYVKSGFEARSHSEEPKCVDLELNVLMSIEDVTSRVSGAVEPGADPATADRARRSIINDIENESREKTGLRSNVITFYNGGLYHLYRYKRYTDVRLVFAPQKAIAFFGGDPDNFEYPRYDLDICFFRVYENNQARSRGGLFEVERSGRRGGRPGFRFRKSGPHRTAGHRGDP